MHHRPDEIGRYVMMTRARLLVRPGDFLCTVTAHGSVNGQLVEITLARHRAPSPVLACQWLRERARWMADRLDPDPEHTPVLAAALHEVPDGVPDAPTVLRDWCRDVPRQGAAVVRLGQGHGVRFMARDDTTLYELSAVPVHVPLPESSRLAGPVPRGRQAAEERHERAGQ
ncbi:hypothetical protein [Streptomyces sp. NPDC058657]|uniref:hypothetical protein n=1 Tax=unclassified Streptomyces TaxID=2593676 RepID=UPI003663AF90